MQNEGLYIDEEPDFYKKMGMDSLPDIYYPQDLKTALEMYGIIDVT